MAYKFKPNKGILKRMKVTKTGKLKHRHEKNSHLRSGRDANLKRELGRASVLDETQAKRFRKLAGIVGLRPNQARHRKELAAAAKTN
jgi:large subunit ribosomal protein L35